MDSSKAIKQSEHALAQKVGETLVLLNPETGQYYTLNEVGSRIWELLDGTRTRDGIVAAICAEYDAGEAEIAADVDALLGDLEAEKLIDGAAAE